MRIYVTILKFLTDGLLWLAAGTAAVRIFTALTPRYAALVMAPFGIYTAVCLLRRRAYPDYNEMSYRFTGRLVLTALVLLIGMKQDNPAAWGGALTSAVLLVLLMRLLRHGEKGAADLRLVLTETLFAGALLGLCLLLSRPGVLQAALAGLKAFARWVISPIGTLLSLVIYGVIWVFMKLFGRLFMPNMDYEVSAGNFQFFTQEELHALPEPVQASPFLAALLRILGAAAVLALLYLLLRRMFGLLKSGPEAAAEQPLRSRLPAQAAERQAGLRLRFGRGPRQQVRRSYGAYLKSLRQRGELQAPGNTSADVEALTRDTEQEAAGQRLRQLYLKARYRDEEAVSPEDAAEARALVRRLAEQTTAPGGNQRGRSL